MGPSMIGLADTGFTACALATITSMPARPVTRAAHACSDGRRAHDEEERDGSDRRYQDRCGEVLGGWLSADPALVSARIFPRASRAGVSVVEASRKHKGPHHRLSRRSAAWPIRL